MWPGPFVLVYKYLYLHWNMGIAMYDTWTWAHKEKNVKKLKVSDT